MNITPPLNDLFDYDEVEPDFNSFDEWQGMPEFVHENQMSFRQIIVHFADQKAVDEFAKLMEQKCGRKTKSIWYPEVKKNNLIDMSYEDLETAGIKYDA